jgi:hypothetical protein
LSSSTTRVICSFRIPKPEIKHDMIGKCTNGDEFAASPDETVLGEGADGIFKCFHIGLIIPWFNLQSVHGNRSESYIKSNERFSDSLRLGGLLLRIRLHSLLLNALSLGILLLITAEEIDILILLGRRGSGLRLGCLAVDVGDIVCCML